MFNELKELGLSEKEVEVYIALLKTGLTTANRLAQMTGIKRSTTYDNLSLLGTKGLVSTIIKNKVNYYEATDPNKIIRLLDEKKERLSKIIPQLQSLKESAKDKTGVIFFEGKKGVIMVLNDILEERESLLFYGSRKIALIAMQDYPDNFIQKRAEAKIPLRAVLAEEDKGDQAYNNRKIYKLSDLRFLKELNEIESNVFIYSDRVAFISSGGNLAGVIIRNQEMVKQQKKIFEVLWKLAKK